MRGFHFHKRTDQRTGKVLPYFWPGQKAMKTVRSKVRQITGYSRKRVPMAKIVNDLNLVIRGWRNYFSAGNSTKQLKALDHYAWLRIGRSFLARQGNRGDSLKARFPEWARLLWNGALLQTRNMRRRLRTLQGNR